MRFSPPRQGRRPSTRLCRWTVLLAFLASLPLVGASTAAAAPGWVLPALSPGAATTDPSAALDPPVVGVDAAGDAIAAWTTDVPGGQGVVVARRPAGGAWGPSQTLSGAPSAMQLSLSVAPGGDALLAWSEHEDDPGGTLFAPQVARFDATSSSWSAPQSFSSSPNPESRPQVQLDDDGTAVLAWYEVDPDTTLAAVRVAHGLGGGPLAAEPAPLSDADVAVITARAPQLLLDADGIAATVAWTAVDQLDGTWHVQESRLAGGPPAWSAPSDIASSADQLLPAQLVATADGGATAIWFTVSPSTLNASQRVDGTWDAPLPVSGDIAPSCTPVGAVGRDVAGSATAIWQEATSGDLVSQRVGAAGPPQSLFAPTGDETVLGAQLAGATAVWTVFDGAAGAWTLFAARAAGDGWAPSLPLAGPSTDGELSTPALAGSPSGDMLAGWLDRAPDGATRVRAAGLQSTAPRFVDVSIAAVGETGAALGFSATARSTFAPSPQLAWSFGDGAAAAGAAVTHSYATAGRFAVSVTATDGFGNATTSSGTVTVTTPDPGPGPGPDPRPEPTPVPVPVPTPRPTPTPAPAPIPRPAALPAPTPASASRTLTLSDGARAVGLTLRNRAAVPLSGRVTLVQLAGAGVRRGRTRLLATQRGFALRPSASRRMTLTLSAAVRAQLRATPRRGLPVRLELRLLAADGRRVTTRLSYTLRAEPPARAPRAPRRTPLARVAC